MPKAFCGLETVRLKPPWPPCALWEKNVTSVKEKPPHAPHKQPNRGNLTYYLLIWNKSAGWWKILTTHQADHTHNTQMSLPTTEDITHKKSACYVLHSSICPSCGKKGMFSDVERPLLPSWKAYTPCKTHKNSLQINVINRNTTTPILSQSTFFIDFRKFILKRLQD